MHPRDCRTPDDVDALCRAIYGEVLGPAVGVQHVCAVAAPHRKAPSRVLRIDERSPKSAWDFFALQLSRARADIVLLTGAILRAEPELSYGFGGPVGKALRHWRTERLGKHAPPELWVLSSGRQLDPGHPVFRGEWPAFLVTDAVGAARCPGLAALEVNPLSLSSVLAKRGERSLSLEAGPATVAPLYGQTPPDEVLLSRFCGALPEERLVGPALPSVGSLAARYPNSSGPRVHREESGTWEFQAFRR